MCWYYYSTTFKMGILLIMLNSEKFNLLHLLNIPSCNRTINNLQRLLVLASAYLPLNQSNVLFRPSTDHASFWIKKPYDFRICLEFEMKLDDKPYNHLVSFNSKWCMVWWWPEQKAKTSNHCQLLMVLLQDGIFYKYIDWLEQWGCVTEKLAKSWNDTMC